MLHEEIFNRFGIAYNDSNNRRIGAILDGEREDVDATFIQHFHHVEQRSDFVGKEYRKLSDARTAADFFRRF